METLAGIAFAQADILDQLLALDDAGLDTLEFGAICIGPDTAVRSYNTCESRLAGLSRERVIGQPMFTVVAPCMNNFMVAQRFEEAAANEAALDLTVDYVLTLRMRPQKVQLRLLARPGNERRFLLVQRRT